MSLEQCSVRLLKELNIIAEWLRQDLTFQQWGGKVFTGHNLATNQVLMAYLSWFPHGDSKEECIDATISMIPLGKDIRLVADIALSSGEIIAQLEDVILEDYDNSQNMQSILTLEKEVGYQIQAHLHQLLEQMS